MRPEALHEASDWLARAERDLQAAAMALHGPRLLPDIAAFHAQQAAEKALKGFLAGNDVPFPKTHNLERLVEMCGAVDADFRRFGAAAKTLNPNVIQFRYPGGPLEPPVSDAQEALELATGVFEFVRDRLPGLAA